MTDSSQFAGIPDEVLLKILEFCDVQSLGRLARSCRKFNELVHTEDCCWRGKSKFVFGSNMNSPEMQRRSKPHMSEKKRCQVSKKWKEGLCDITAISRYTRCMPWIILEQEYLFCSKEKMLIRFSRNDDGNILCNKIIKLVPHSDDVSKFASNENEIVTACRDGTIGRWRKRDLQCIHNFIAHSSQIHCVDAKNDIIASGSRDKTVKLWKTTANSTVNQKEINLNVRVLSVAIMPSNHNFIVGLPGTNEIHPLKLFDLARGEFLMNLGTEFRRGAGILDIYPESEHTFLCCGYDTTVKLWDIRTPETYVASWMDPYDNSIYCVQSDHNVTIISGANRNGLVHLWDKRHTGRCQCIQQSDFYNSPVYSIAFDSSHLFTAFDRAVVQFSYL